MISMATTVALTTRHNKQTIAHFYNKRRPHFKYPAFLHKGPHFFTNNSQLVPMEVNSSYRSASRNSLNNYRDAAKKETQDKRRAILHLIHKYLLDNNYTSVAEKLQNEALVALNYQVCDNVDLDIILQEYQSYYYMKYQKNAKIIRKMDENEQIQAMKNVEKRKLRAVPHVSPPAAEDNDNNKVLELNIVPLSKSPTKLAVEIDNNSQEWKEMADQITAQIIPKTLNVTFNDCIGLNEPLERLKESVIYPLDYPQLFQNMSPWRGILLYGPPGTGKTLLVKALACQSHYTIINVSSSVFVSKWRGESEKLLKTLFEVAKLNAPSAIFIDEIDALVNQDANHEASRRFKSELLTQIDGVMDCDTFVLAATNCPWSIDGALLRRFEKRVLVPLPDKNARFNMLRMFLCAKNEHGLTGEDLKSFVERSDSLSGSDLVGVCKEVQMILIREALQQVRDKPREDVRKVRKITGEDVVRALDRVRACMDKSEYKKYKEWESKFGSS